MVGNPIDKINNDLKEFANSSGDFSGMAPEKLIDISKKTGDNEALGSGRDDFDAIMEPALKNKASFPESATFEKLKKWLYNFDKKFDSNARSETELYAQIKNLSDRTLELWYNNGKNLNFGTAGKVFQDKAVEREMIRRNLIK